MTSDEEEDHVVAKTTRPQKRARKASALSTSEMNDPNNAHNSNSNSGDDAGGNNGSSTTSSTTSKPRQGSKDKGTDDPQRERKRILDRLSQRATRDRTRNKIAYLEDLVRKFETQSESDQIRDLLRQVEDLRVEKDRLARCLGQISGLVECAVNPKGGTPQGKEDGSNEDAGDPGPSPGPTTFQTQPIPEVPIGLSPFPQKGQLATPAFTPSPNTTFAPMTDAGRPAVLPSASHSLALPGGVQGVQESLGITPHPYFEGGGVRVSPPPPQQGRAAPTTQGDISPNYDLEGGSFPTNASTTAGMEPGKQDMIIRDSWTYSNVTLSRGLAACRRLQQIQKRLNKGKLPPSSLDWSIPVRAVKYGWDSVKAEVDPHKQPIWAVLKLIDTRIFGNNPPTERLAVLAIMALTMQYYLYPTIENRDKLPTWLRTRPSQENVKNYPITVDFFVWPGVRDRFVFQHAEYSAVSTLFSMKFRENLRFLWPEGFDDIWFTTPGATQFSKPVYRLAPKFESAIRDLNRWAMNADFFQTFPELADDIPKYNGPAGLGGSMRLPPKVWVSWDYPPEFGNAAGHAPVSSTHVVPKLEELLDEEKEREVQRRWEVELQQLQQRQAPIGHAAAHRGSVVRGVGEGMTDAPAYTTATGPTGWMPDPNTDFLNSLPLSGAAFGYAPDPMMMHVTQPGY